MPKRLVQTVSCEVALLQSIKNQVPVENLSLYVHNVLNLSNKKKVSTGGKILPDSKVKNFLTLNVIAIFVQIEVFVQYLLIAKRNYSEKVSGHNISEHPIIYLHFYKQAFSVRRS